jgi:hypothetical protein
MFFALLSVVNKIKSDLTAPKLLKSIRNHKTKRENLRKKMKIKRIIIVNDVIYLVVVTLLYCDPTTTCEAVLG